MVEINGQDVTPPEPKIVATHQIVINVTMYDNDQHNIHIQGSKDFPKEMAARAAGLVMHTAAKTLDRDYMKGLQILANIAAQYAQEEMKAQAGKVVAATPQDVSRIIRP